MMMRTLMKNIPNTITCLNLFSGSLACVLSLEKNYIGAFIFIVFAAIFDFLDGFAARLLKAYSPLGKELDSLADVVSFGLAPGLLVFSFLREMPESSSIGTGIHFTGFLIPVFAAIRLAKFNIDTRQTNSFLGLPVPANALFWGALIPALNTGCISGGLFPSLMMIPLILVFCCLMVSELPMFSLKFKTCHWSGNERQYSLIIITILLILFFRISGISLSIVAYILMSIPGKMRKKD